LRCWGWSCSGVVSDGDVVYGAGVVGDGGVAYGAGVVDDGGVYSEIL
jgi:hypothetical protein